MNLTEIKLGKPLEIFIYRGGIKYRLVSKVEDVSEQRVCVTLIESRSRVFTFCDRDEIEFIYRDDDRLWKWKNVKGDFTELDGSRLHCFYTDEEGKSFNRRDAYRVFVGEVVNITYQRCDETNPEEKEKYQDFICQGFVKDVSESGVGIFLNEIIELGEEVAFELSSQFWKLACKAEVVRTASIKQGPYKKYYGCCFTQSDRNLIKYIFYLQRQQLQNTRKNV